MSHIRDISLAPAGRAKIDWARRHTPVLAALEERFTVEKPFAGLRVAMSIHLEAKTARLALLLKAGGAEVYATGCNPLSTQDDVAAALSEHVAVFGIHGATAEEYEEDLLQVLSCHPHLLIDDGGDLLRLLHEVRPDLADCLIGGAEETTTGIRRLMARAQEGKLNFPMFNVNDADCKHLFDNRYGTGQSVWDGIMRTTNLTVAGRVVVVAGYGWCGKGVSMRAKGLGARVVVTEVDPVRAIEAVMDGFDVLPMDEACKEGDIFITVTGCRDVITRRHMETMKDGAVMCNAGHFDVEVSRTDLEDYCTCHATVKPNIESYSLPDGRTLYLLAEGRLVNLAAGDGHPCEIMDMSFALQASCMEHLALHGADLAPALYPVPVEIDRAVALLRLKTMGIAIDELTDYQRDYIAGKES